MLHRYLSSYYWFVVNLFIFLSKCNDSTTVFFFVYDVGASAERKMSPKSNNLIHGGPCVLHYRLFIRSIELYM